MSEVLKRYRSARRSGLQRGVAIGRLAAETGIDRQSIERTLFRAVAEDRRVPVALVRPEELG